MLQHTSRDTFSYHILSICLLFAFMACFSTPAYGQQKEKTIKEHKAKVSVVPYLNYDKTYGFAFGVLPLLPIKLNKKDTISPRSTFGMIAFYTTNKSFMTLAFGRMFFDEDRWRIKAALGGGDFNNQTYLEVPGEATGDFYTFSNEVFLITAKVSRKIAGKNFLGLGVAYKTYETVFDSIAQSSTSNDLSLEPLFSFDTRSDVYYPRSGTKLEIQGDFYASFLGNDVTGSSVDFALNKYFSFAKAKNNVLALRAYADLGFGTVNFQRQTTIGGKDLRGYTTGEYRGNGIMDIQGEYRINFENKLGLVVFTGLATMYGSSIDDYNWKLYPNLGAGMRYNAIPATGMNVGFDLALGKDDWGFYFRIGEAF